MQEAHASARTALNFLGSSAAARLVLGGVLTRLTRSVRQRHPEILSRMGRYSDAKFLIDPLGLPLVFLLHPGREAPVAVLPRHHRKEWDSRITGTLPDLLALMEGRLDGDALFFSGHIAVQGNTSAVLALRNALDASEIDLISEGAVCAGPFQDFADQAARKLLPFATRILRTFFDTTEEGSTDGTASRP